MAIKKVTKTSTKKTTVKKAPAKKVTTKKAPAKIAAKKAVAKKAAPKKVIAKKAPAKKATVKVVAKKTVKKAAPAETILKKVVKKAAPKAKAGFMKMTNKTTKNTNENAGYGMIVVAEKEAEILKIHANFLQQAAKSKNEYEIVAALDANLKLWVEIETSLKSAAKSMLPKEVKENLLKLSKFVERFTLSKGIKMTQADFNTLININTQVSEGLIQTVKNSLATEEAFSLLKCAVDLSSARESKNTKQLVTALDNNLKLWVYIKTLAKDKNNPLPKETKTNLIKLSEYVSGKTLEMGRNIHNVSDKTLDSMIMTNLQISEGLMTRAKKA